MVNEKCFLAINDEKDKRDFNSAQLYCEKISANLAEIENNEENDLVASISGSQYAWIGIRRNETNKNTWIFPSGKSATYFNWNSGEPNNYKGRNEDCTMMYSSNHQTVSVRKRWNDATCSDTYRFVCSTQGEILKNNQNLIYVY